MMRAKYNNFYFGKDKVHLEPRRVNARIPAGIETAEKLIDALDVNLGFPDYFGRNWDALDECIRDLNWLAPVQVVIDHDDVPLKNDLERLEIYLSILYDAVDHWERRKEHKLIVIFPTEYERKIRWLMHV